MSNDNTALNILGPPIRCVDSAVIRQVPPPIQVNGWMLRTGGRCANTTEVESVRRNTCRRTGRTNDQGHLIGQVRCAALGGV